MWVYKWERCFLLLGDLLFCNVKNLYEKILDLNVLFEDLDFFLGKNKMRDLYFIVIEYVYKGVD